jgi:hypothetical protein
MTVVVVVFDIEAVPDFEAAQRDGLSAGRSDPKISPQTTCNS